MSYSTVEYTGLRLDHPELHTTTYEEKDVGNPGDFLEESEEAIEEIQMDDDDSNNAAQVLKKRHHRHHQKRGTTTARLRRRPSGSPPSSIGATIRLKNTSTLSLDAGKSKDVKFRIRRSALAYHGRNLRKRVEKGSFTVTVNAMRPEAQSIKFNVV